jgi:hypothetical protein
MAFYLYWLEHTDFSTWLRESPSLLVFPTILTLHTIGMAFLAGTNVAIDLRLLGVAPGMRVGPMQRFLPLMWSGFWINALSGMLLLIAYPTKALTNWDFYVKLTFIALGLVTTVRIRREVFAAPQLDSTSIPTRWRVLATASLICWTGAIISGRLLAHTYSQLLTEKY